MDITNCLKSPLTRKEEEEDSILLAPEYRRFYLPSLEHIEIWELYFLLPWKYLK